MGIIWEKITNTSNKLEEGDEPITMVHDYVDPETDKLHHYEIKPGKSIRTPFVGLHRLFQNLYPAKYIKVEQIEAPEGELEPWGDAIHPVWSNTDWTEQVSVEFGGKLTVKKGLSFWDKDRFTFLILPLGGGRTLTGSAAIKKAVEEDALPESAYKIAAQYGFTPDEKPDEKPKEPEETPKEKPEEKPDEKPEEKQEGEPEEKSVEPQYTIAEWGKRYRASKGISNKEIAGMEEYIKGTSWYAEHASDLYTREEFLAWWSEFCAQGGEE